MAEKFPRLRDNTFKYASTVKVPERFSGRLDLLCGEQFGVSELYKVIAAANSITNPFALRATIRPMDEGIRNELILKGYRGAELEAKYRAAIETTVVGERDWHDYASAGDGCISEVSAGRTLYIPDAATGSAWFEKYNTVED